VLLIDPGTIFISSLLVNKTKLMKRNGQIRLTIFCFKDVRSESRE